MLCNSNRILKFFEKWLFKKDVKAKNDVLLICANYFNNPIFGRNWNSLIFKSFPKMYYNYSKLKINTSLDKNLFINHKTGK